MRRNLVDAIGTIMARRPRWCTSNVWSIMMLFAAVSVPVLAARTAISSSLWNSTLSDPTTVPQTRQALLTALSRQQHFCQDVFPADIEQARLSQWFNDSTPFRIYVHSGTDIVSSQVLTTGKWADDLLQDIFWALNYQFPGAVPSKEPPIFIDTGANFGWLTMNVAAKGFRVVSFEAMLANQKMLRNSLCLTPEVMDRVVFFALGLGDKKQQCYMYSLATNIGNGNSVCGASREEVERVMPPRCVIRSEMTVHRLDRLLAGQDIRVLKIDVEGFEPLVMYGASELLKSGKILFACLEMFPDYQQRNLRNPNATIEFIDFLVSLPYRVSILGFDRGYLSPADARRALYGHRTRDDIFLARADLPIVGGV